MTLNGNTHSTYMTAAGEPKRIEGVNVALNKTVSLVEENAITVSVIDKLKARSLRAIRRSRSRKKRVSVRRSSHTVDVRSKRGVHFDVPAEKEVEHSPTEFAKLHVFCRSSKFRRPVRRVSRAKGSPSLAELAKIHRIAENRYRLLQPEFDQMSDAVDEVEEDPLPPILLQSLRNETPSTSDAYTVLPAITVTTTATASTASTELEEKRHFVASTVVRRRSSAIPGYVYRHSSVAARSSYESNQLQYRKKRRKRPYRRPRKIVVIGNMCSGKSSLISAYCRDKFSEMYVPTILTSCMTDAEVMGEKIELVVVEVAGRIDYAKIHRCAYHRMDLVILCYSTDSPASLQAIKDNWLPELKKAAPKVPYILVGTKKDIREKRVCKVEVRHSQKQDDSTTNDKSNSLCHDDLLTDNTVTRRQGLETAEMIGAQDFLECSAMYRDGTRYVFERATKIALRRSPRRKKKHTSRADTCTIM